MARIKNQYPSTENQGQSDGGIRLAPPPGGDGVSDPCYIPGVETSRVSTPPGGGGPSNGGLDLRAWFGDMDIYLFDQLLKGRFRTGMRLLDAGCGTGRNLTYFLRGGFDVHAVDEDGDALDHVREMAAELAPALPADHFRTERIEAMSFPPARFDAILCNAVLHFARDEDHFQAMLAGLWKALAAGGLLFMRLASSIGIEDRLERMEDGLYRMPAGGTWFLVNEAKLLLATERLDAEMVEPLKTVNVQNLRCMTTWVLRKKPDRKPREARPDSPRLDPALS